MCAMTPPEFASKTNEYITSYIVFADTKAGAVLTFTSLLGVTAGFVAPVLLKAARTAGTPYFWGGWLAAASVTVGVTMTLWHCLAALTPRTPNAGKSLHSFPDIAAMRAADLVRDVAALTPAGSAEHLSLHNSTLAGVAMAKFMSLGKATWWLRIALLGTVASSVLFAVVSVVGEAN